MTDKTCDIVYSSDDDSETGLGWYFQKWPSQDTSDQSYGTKDECIEAALAEGLTIDEVLGND